MSTKFFRAVVASGVLFGAFAALSPAAFAGTTDTVPLSGEVTSTLSISSAATTDAGALALDGKGTSGEHIVKVSDLTMTTNNEQGLTLTVSSGNLTSTGASPIAYQVKTVADSGAAPASGDFTVASGTSYTDASSGAGNYNRDLYIKYTPAALQDPGTYTATINLSVADN